MEIKVKSKLMYPKSYFEQKFSTPNAWNLFTSEYEFKKYERQIETIKLFCPQPQNILEIGCGEGAHTLLLADAFPQARIVGLDISHNAITRAKENCKEHENIHLVEADVVELLRRNRMPEKQYDVTIQSESIYYIGARLLLPPRIYGYLSSVVKTVKCGGIFVTSNRAELPGKLIMHSYYWILSHMAHPVYTASQREWKEEEKRHIRYDIRVYTPHPSTPPG